MLAHSANVVRFQVSGGIMPLIERFEDIHAWQEARRLMNLVYGKILDCAIKSDALRYPQ